jgi:GNAT superfamily N-acetyltransferase
MCSAEIRQARPDERVPLEALQRRSSMHHPMYREQLTDHPDAIHLPLDKIEAGRVRVCEHGTVVLGFSVLLAPTAGVCELDGLFVEPAHMRTGVGRRLIEDAARMA